MVLGVSKLIELVESSKLVEGLSQRELENPEGTGFDLRIGRLHELGDTRGFLGIEERNTADHNLVAGFVEGSSEVVKLKPRTYYVATTVEKVNLPSDITCLFTPRSTLYRSGVSLFNGNGPPGYSGTLTFGIYNFGHSDFELEMGARIIHALFYQVDGETSLYRGQWQGGRISTDEREQQV